MQRGPHRLGDRPPEPGPPAGRALGDTGRGLSLQIPEEHDLESQILKEREWRFLRNARVRRQARRLIQKGEGAGAGGCHRGCVPATFHQPCDQICQQTPNRPQPPCVKWQ